MEFWKILLDDIKKPVSYLPMGVGAAIMMLLLLRLVAGEKAWKRPQVYYYFLLGVYETVVSYRITCNNGNQRTLINP